MKALSFIVYLKIAKSLLSGVSIPIYFIAKALDETSIALSQRIDIESNDIESNDMEINEVRELSGARSCRITRFFFNGYFIKHSHNVSE